MALLTNCKICFYIIVHRSFYLELAETKLKYLAREKGENEDDPESDAGDKRDGEYVKGLHDEN